MVTKGGSGRGGVTVYRRHQQGKGICFDCKPIVKSEISHYKWSVSLFPVKKYQYSGFLFVFWRWENRSLTCHWSSQCGVEPEYLEDLPGGEVPRSIPQVKLAHIKFGLWNPKRIGHMTRSLEQMSTHSFFPHLSTHSSTHQKITLIN